MYGVFTDKSKENNRCVPAAGVHHHTGSDAYKSSAHSLNNKTHSKSNSTEKSFRMLLSIGGVQDSRGYDILELFFIANASKANSLASATAQQALAQHRREQAAIASSCMHAGMQGNSSSNRQRLNARSNSQYSNHNKESTPVHMQYSRNKDYRML